MALLRRGDAAAAEPLARNAVRLAPLNSQAHALFAMVLTESQRPAAGEVHYRRALDLSGRRHPVLLANLAWNLTIQGRMAAARELYRESLAAAPGERQTLLGLARLEEAAGDFPAANQALDRLEALAPGDPALTLSRAVILRRTGHEAQALALLEAAASETADGAPGSEALFEMGRNLDRLGRHDDAFDAFTQAKDEIVRQTGAAYLDDQAALLSRRLSSFFSRERLGILPRAAPPAPGPRPIFILGFPRSGTTMVEQILAAHPDIVGGGELPFVNELAAIAPSLLGSPLPYPEALSELWMADRAGGLDRMRDHYLDGVGRMDVLRPREGEPAPAWFTDKMPLNETHLALIALMFPSSPLLHLVRHPLDVMVSAMSIQFSHGLSCGSSLRSAALHYVRVMDLVDHTLVQTAFRYRRIRYEDLVRDHETGVRDLLGFVGVAEDERCLRFWDNPRHAHTASYAQVTQPIHDRSIGRYRHYRRVVDEAAPILEPVIRRLGYRIDA